MYGKRWLSGFVATVMGCVICLAFPTIAEEEVIAYPSGAARVDDGKIAISTKQDFYNIRNNPEGDYYLTNDIVFLESDFGRNGAYYNDGYGGISADIDFSGRLDGRGYSLIGLRAYDSYTPIFHTNSGTIENFSIEDFNYTKAGGSILTRFNRGIIRNCQVRYGEIYFLIGAFAETNEGEISNCSLRDYTIPEKDADSDYSRYSGIAYKNRGTIQYCQNDKGDSEIIYCQGGGICWSNSGQIIGCVNYTKLKGSNSGCAGIVKNNEGTVQECCNYADLNGYVAGIAYDNMQVGIVQDCANEGNLYGYSAGGIVSNNGGEITRCYGQGDVQGGGGKIIGFYESGRIRKNYCVGTPAIGEVKQYTNPNDSTIILSSTFYPFPTSIYNDLDLNAVWEVTSTGLALRSLQADKLQGLILQSEPLRTRYHLGNTLNMTGMTVLKVLNFGETELLEEGYTINGELSQYGEIPITVSYEGQECQFNAVVTVPISLCKVTVTVNENPMPYVTVTYKGKRLRENTDYMVAYDDDSVTVTGINAYSDQIVEEYESYTLGDVNGDRTVTGEDALLALQAATNRITLEGWQEKAAEVNGDGIVSAEDALVILQYVTKKITAI